MTQITIQIPEKHIEILKLTADGYTSKQIGAELSTSAKNVERIKRILLDQFGCKNTAHLIKVVIQKKIIEL